MSIFVVLLISEKRAVYGIVTSQKCETVIVHTVRSTKGNLVVKWIFDTNKNVPLC